MAFELDEQHKMLRTTVKDFAAKEIAPIARDIDRSGAFPWDCARKMGKLGMCGLLTPPAYGGTGPDKIGFMVALEEIAAASAGVALAMCLSATVSSVILSLGNEAQKKRYLPQLASGESLAAFGSIEPNGGSNYAFTLQTTARLDGDAYVLNGTKCFISNGSEADIYLVLARTDPAKGIMGIAGFIVEKGTPGFSFGNKDDKLGLRGDVTAELVFADCRIPKANLLAEGILMPMAGALGTLTRPAFGAISLGIARASLAAATDYVKQRGVTPGFTLANFDGVQATIADMMMLVEASRLMVYEAVTLPNGANLLPSMMAGIFPCESAVEVADKAMQVFGTYGYTAAFPVERYYRDARGMLLVAQPVELRRLSLGRFALGAPPIVPPIAPAAPPPPKP